MIEMRWLDRVVEQAGYGQGLQVERVLQYRNWPSADMFREYQHRHDPGRTSYIEPQWQDVQVTDGKP